MSWAINYSERLATPNIVLSRRDVGWAVLELAWQAEGSGFRESRQGENFGWHISRAIGISRISRCLRPCRLPAVLRMNSARRCGCGAAAWIRKRRIGCGRGSSSCIMASGILGRWARRKFRIFWSIWPWGAMSRRARRRRRSMRWRFPRSQARLGNGGGMRGIRPFSWKRRLLMETTLSEAARLRKPKCPAARCGGHDGSGKPFSPLVPELHLGTRAETRTERLAWYGSVPGRNVGRLVWSVSVPDRNVGRLDQPAGGFLSQRGMGMRSRNGEKRRWVGIIPMRGSALAGATTCNIQQFTFCRTQSPPAFIPRAKPRSPRAPSRAPSIFARPCRISSAARRAARRKSPRCIRLFAGSN